jgi:hypothetical protein
MRGLARPDRSLDVIEHGSGENTPRAPAMFDQMPCDAPDAHPYQLPEAPPPLKLPPPPLKPLSLSLELELELPLDHPPPPLQPEPESLDRPPRPRWLR